MKDRLYITKADYEKLQRLIEGRRTTGSFDMKYLSLLEAELDLAEVVEPEAIPPDVVTMNSEVRLKDLDSGNIIVYRLVFPSQARTENSISVLAPIGMAMLGYQVGDIIEWPVPRGIRRFKVLEVLFQPEAAGVSGG
jgi:regulator of nucleoside diphosphate kinase